MDSNPVKKAKYELQKEQILLWKEDFRCFKCKVFINPMTKPIEELNQCYHPDPHCYCQKCAEEVKKICKAPNLTDSKIVRMSLDAQALAQKMWKNFPQFCENEANGCNEFLNDSEMEDHLKKCLHKTINCSISDCTMPVTYYNFMEHYEQFHSGELTVFGPSRVFKHGKCFFHSSFYVRSSGLAYFWTYFLGTKEEANDFAFEYYFRGSSGEELRYSCKVISMEVSVMEIITEALTFNLNYKMLGRFFPTHSRNEKARFDIRSLKELQEDSE